MKKGLLKIFAAGIVMSFVVLTSTVTVKCNEDGWYTGNEIDKLLEDFKKDMEADGWIVDNSEVGGGSQDPKIAHPTQEPAQNQEPEQKQPAHKQQEQKKQEPVKTCDHVYESKVTKEPTCAEEGEMVSTCKKCGESYSTPIPVTDNHQYAHEITKEATCTESGVMTYTCDVCGDSYTEEIQPTGHNYDRCVAEDATCTMPGTFVYICTACNDSYTEEIPAEGHGDLETFIDEPAGLFTKGRQITRCTVCNEVIETMDIPSRASSGFAKIGNFFRNLF